MQPHHSDCLACHIMNIPSLAAERGQQQQLFWIQGFLSTPGADDAKFSVLDEKQPKVPVDFIIKDSSAEISVSRIERFSPSSSSSIIEKDRCDLHFLKDNDHNLNNNQQQKRQRIKQENDDEDEEEENNNTSKRRYCMIIGRHARTKKMTNIVLATQIRELVYSPSSSTSFFPLKQRRDFPSCSTSANNNNTKIISDVNNRRAKRRNRGSTLILDGRQRRSEQEAEEEEENLNLLDEEEEEEQDSHYDAGSNKEITFDRERDDSNLFSTYSTQSLNAEQLWELFLGQM